MDEAEQADGTAKTNEYEWKWQRDGKWIGSTLGQNCDSKGRDHEKEKPGRIYDPVNCAPISNRFARLQNPLNVFHFRPSPAQKSSVAQSAAACDGGSVVLTASLITGGT